MNILFRLVILRPKKETQKFNVKKWSFVIVKSELDADVVAQIHFFDVKFKIRDITVYTTMEYECGNKFDCFIYIKNVSYKHLITPNDINQRLFKDISKILMNKSSIVYIPINLDHQINYLLPDNYEIVSSGDIKKGTLIYDMAHDYWKRNWVDADVYYLSSIHKVHELSKIEDAINFLPKYYNNTQRFFFANPI